jgi:tetratricopeptide (TPR) repeat protein
MRIVEHLSDLALRQLLGESAGAVLGLFRDRFSDQGRLLLEALRTAQVRAWGALEIALAGTSWWETLRPALVSREEEVLDREVRSFLDAAPLPELAGKSFFRKECLRELQEARRGGLLDGTLSAAELEGKASSRVRYANPQAVMLAEWQALEGLAAELEGKGCKSLAWLLRQRPSSGPPLLVLAVRYFFRRAVEEDAELSRGLTFGQLDSLSQTQAIGFADLHAALQTHGRLLSEKLDTLQQGIAAVEEKVDTLRGQMQTQHDELMRLVTDMLRQVQMDARPLRPGDSRSLQTDHERGKVQALVRQYRSLPESQRQATPALLNGLGKLQVAAGDFEGARRDFAAAAAAATDPGEQAEAYFNAYQAAIEEGEYDDALAALREALARDPDRFAPFPLDEYAPQRILGAGGFGVTFLCRSQTLSHWLAVKALDPAEKGRRAISTVFREAIALAQLHHPGIIQLRQWGYADPAKTRPYVAMEYFEAQTLEEHVREHGPLPFAAFKEVARLIADALRAAHARDVLHRDLKPANILVRQGEGGWEVRLIDFGLALGREEADTGSTVRGAGVTGTLDYAAPEQLGRLPGATVGPPADVYGFGRTCCYALFATPNPRPQHWQEVRPSLARLLGDCLAEEPDQRPAGFAEVLERLAKVRAPRRRGKGAAAEEPEAPLPPRLVVVRGLRPGVEYALREGVNIIGRGDDTAVEVDLESQEADGRVWSSRRHALLTCKEGRLALTDLNSANGTFVNRTRLAPGQEHPVQPGDVIQVGSVQLRVEA